MTNINEMHSKSVVPFAKKAVKGLQDERKGALSKQTFACAALLAGQSLAVEFQDQRALTAFRDFYIGADSEVERDRTNRVLVAAGFAQWNDDDTSVSWATDVGFHVEKTPSKTGGDPKLACPDYSKIVAACKTIMPLIVWCLRVEADTGIAIDDLIHVADRRKPQIAGEMNRVWIREYFLEGSDTRDANKPNQTRWTALDGKNGIGHNSFRTAINLAKEVIGKKTATTAASKVQKLTTALDAVSERSSSMIAKGEAPNDDLKKKMLDAMCNAFILLGITDPDGANFNAEMPPTMFAQWLAEQDVASDDSGDSDNQADGTNG